MEVRRTSVYTYCYTCGVELGSQGPRLCRAFVRHPVPYLPPHNMNGAAELHQQRRRHSSAASVASSSRTSSSGRKQVYSTHDYTYALPDNRISEWLKCPICLAPFVHPTLVPECEHVFCRACLDQHILSRAKCTADESAVIDEDDAEMVHSHGQCPTCRMAFSASALKPAALLIKNMVDSLLVKCPHEKRGCPHVCERGLIDCHASNDCGWAFVGEYGGKAMKRRSGSTKSRGERGSSGRCECGKRVLRKDWEEHCQSGQCSVVWVLCPHSACEERVKESQMDEHKEMCPAKPVACDYCNVHMCQAQVEEHLHLCQKYPIECTFAQFGCAWRGPRQSLDGEGGHLQSCIYSRLEPFLLATATRMAELETENTEMTRRMQRMEEEQASQRTNMDGIMRIIGDFPGLSEWNVSRRVHEETTTPRDHGLVVPMSSPPFDGQTPSSPPLALRGRSGSAVNVGSLSDSHGASGTPLSAPLASAPLEGQSMWHWPTPEDQQQHENTMRSVQRSASRLSIHQDQSADPLSNGCITHVLRDLQQSVSTLTEQVSTLERRLDDVHVLSHNAAFESGRAHEELNSLRHGVHSIRIQMHSLLMQQRGMYTNPTNSAQQAEASIPLMNSGPSLLGLRRYWTGLEQTKL